MYENEIKNTFLEKVGNLFTHFKILHTLFRGWTKKSKIGIRK